MFITPTSSLSLIFTWCPDHIKQGQKLYLTWLWAFSFPSSSFFHSRAVRSGQSILSEESRTLPDLVVFVFFMRRKQASHLHFLCFIWMFTSFILAYYCTYMISPIFPSYFQISAIEISDHAFNFIVSFPTPPLTVLMHFLQVTQESNPPNTDMHDHCATQVLKYEESSPRWLWYSKRIYAFTGSPVSSFSCLWGRSFFVLVKKLVSMRSPETMV